MHSLRLPLPLFVMGTVFLLRAPMIASSGITDPDFYWHLAYGDWILAHWAIPRYDAWSWSFQGHPYQLTQWLGEVCLALAHRAGDVGTAVLSAALSTACLAGAYATARQYLTNRIGAILMALLATTPLLALPCRPQMFSYAACACMAYLVAHHHVTGRNTKLFLLPILFALWGDLHGGYAFGLAALWICAIADLTSAAVTRTPLKPVLPLVLATAASTFATLVNPYGIHLWFGTLQVLGLSSARVILEWQPTSLATSAGWDYLFFSLATLLALACSSKRPSPRTLLILIAFQYMGWSSLRVSALAMLMMVPILAEYARSTPFYQLALERDGARLDRDVSVRVWAPAIIVIVAAGWLAFHDTAGLDQARRKLPIDAVDFMRTSTLRGRLLNSPEAGGYVIRHLGMPVFIDTRLDLYGDAFVFDYLSARNGEPSWQAFMDRTRPDVVLIERNQPLHQLLLTSGRFRSAFDDGHWTVLLHQTFDAHS